MSRLTRDATAEPVSRDQILRANGDMEKSILIFPVQLTTSRIGNITRLILTLAILCDDHTSYIPAEHFFFFFLSCSRLRLKIWSCGTGSAVVPSRASLLILHTQVESGAFTHGNFASFRGGVQIFIPPTDRHRASPEVIRSCDCVPIASNAQSPTAH